MRVSSRIHLFRQAFFAETLLEVDPVAAFEIRADQPRIDDTSRSSKFGRYPIVGGKDWFSCVVTGVQRRPYCSSFPRGGMPADRSFVESTMHGRSRQHRRGCRCLQRLQQSLHIRQGDGGGFGDFRARLPRRTFSPACCGMWRGDILQMELVACVIFRNQQQIARCIRAVSPAPPAWHAHTAGENSDSGGCCRRETGFMSTGASLKPALRRSTEPYTGGACQPLGTEPVLDAWHASRMRCSRSRIRAGRRGGGHGTMFASLRSVGLPQAQCAAAKVKMWPAGRIQSRPAAAVLCLL